MLEKDEECISILTNYVNYKKISNRVEDNKKHNYTRNYSNKSIVSMYYNIYIVDVWVNKIL